MKIRGLKEEEIITVCEMLSCAYRERPGGRWLDPEFFLRFILNDPFYSPELVRVVEEDGRIVSSVRIFERELYGRERHLRLAGIGNVGTLPEYRGRGLATALLQDALLTMEKRGADISILFTGSPAFYERVGWLRYPLRGVVFSSPRPSSYEPRYRLRSFTPESKEELDAITQLYEKTYSSTTGPVRRTQDYWTRWVVDWRWETAEVWLATSSGNVIGYIAVEPAEPIWRVLELGFEEEEVLEFFGYFLSYRCRSKGVEYLYLGVCGSLGAERAFAPHWESIEKRESGMMVQMVGGGEVPEGLIYLPADHF